MSDDDKRSFPTDVKASAHKIWLAGLGALTVAEEEGTKLFKNLVEKGETYEATGREKAEALRDRVEATADRVKGEATGLWSRFDERIEDAVSSAMGRAGVPNRDEIATLTKRVEELTRLVEQLKAS